jgi:hypothetical protein
LLLIVYVLSLKVISVTNANKQLLVETFSDGMLPLLLVQFCCCLFDATSGPTWQRMWQIDAGAASSVSALR